MRTAVGLAPSVVALALASSGCERPLVARDGTVVFPERGARGAAIVTANGLEFRDGADVPQRVVSRDPHEPWRAPVGFILPANGRFTETSRPTIVATTGLAFVLRPSDTRVPVWGGEVLVRVDVLAPAAEGMARDGENVALVLDGQGRDTLRLVDAVLAQLGSRDRLTVVDVASGRVVVPNVPASHRSLALAATRRSLERSAKGGGAGASGPSLAKALRQAASALGDAPRTRRVVVLTDRDGDSGFEEDLQKELDGLARGGVRVSAFTTESACGDGFVSGLAAFGGGAYSGDADVDARAGAVRDAVPAPGVLVFRDVVLRFEGVPAPSHVLESSGGEVRWRLDAGELLLGDVYAGEARTEVLRVTVPAWVSGEPFRFVVTADADDVARAERRSFRADVACLYDDDIERIARSRHGDVIAYASALATLRRLSAAFVGDDVARAGGLHAIAALHAKSMALLARDMRDRSMAEQADVLRALIASEP
jgi:hypothetical protein